jgi:hypothetical protein
VKADPRASAVALASEEISESIHGLQQQHGLTDVEMMQAVLTWQKWKLQQMLRAERHPDGPDGIEGT